MEEKKVIGHAKCCWMMEKNEAQALSTEYDHKGIIGEHDKSNFQWNDGDKWSIILCQRRGEFLVPIFKILKIDPG